MTDLNGPFDDPQGVARAIEEGKLDKAHLVVCWKADEMGYEVTVFDASTSQVVYEYHAGNSPHDSQQWVVTGHGVSERTLRRWARQTAEETAGEIGLPQSIVFEEED